MNKAQQDNEWDRSEWVSQEIRDFIVQMDNECKMLVVLKAQLYGNDWQGMLDDLNVRLTGKPYISNLASKINCDIKRIGELKRFEADNNVDLADYVELGGVYAGPKGNGQTATTNQETENIPFQQFEPLKILMDPGQATPDDIAELFFRLSVLYRMMGGAGLEFRILDVREGALSHG